MAALQKICWIAALFNRTGEEPYMTLQDYLKSLRGKHVAVTGIGVSNRPLLRLLLDAGIDVTACDRKGREALGGLAEELEASCVWGKAI